MSNSEFEKALANGTIQALMAVSDNDAVVIEQTAPAPVQQPQMQQLDPNTQFNQPVQQPQFNQVPPVQQPVMQQPQMQYQQPVQQPQMQQPDPNMQFNQQQPVQQPQMNQPQAGGPGLEDIRNVLTGKVDAGKATEVTALLAKYQTDSLTNLNPASYAAFHQEAIAI